MSDQYRTEPVHRVTMIHQETGRDHPDARRGRLPPHAYEDPTRKIVHHPDDVAGALGLSADHLTPDVLEALAPLLAELDRLRMTADQAQRRLNWMDRQSDRHSVVPSLTRRAFMRELDSFMAGQGRGTVCVLQVAGIEALRQLHGMAAGEGALRHICAHVIGALRNGDLVGCVGGSDFAILLPGADQQAARQKMDEIVGHILNPPYHWLGQRIPMTPAWGVHEIEPGEGAEQAVAAADRVRRGLS